MRPFVLILALLLLDSPQVRAQQDSVLVPMPPELQQPCQHGAGYLQCLDAREKARQKWSADQAKARSLSRVDVQRRDNAAIQAAQKDIKAEERVTDIIDHVIAPIIEDAPKRPLDTGPRMDEAIKSVREMLGACVECEIEHQSDREYLTKKFSAEAKRLDDERHAHVISCVGSCPRAPLSAYMTCWDNCQKVR